MGIDILNAQGCEFFGGIIGRSPAIQRVFEAIQKDIDALKEKKDTLDPARYDQEMERLLTNLALKTKAIRDREAKP